MAELPDWRPIDGVAPSISPSGDSGPVVALVVTREAAEQGWAASSAIDLARRWSDDGWRVMLIDGGLESPSLHRAAGLPNREGLTDATFHGASIARVSRPVDGGAFFLVTAGGPVIDTASVPRSTRWSRLISGMAEAGVLVALYLRDGDGAAPAFLGAASDIVVLSGQDEDSPASVGELGPLVRAVVGREAAPPSPSVESPVRPRSAVPSDGGPAQAVLFVLIAVVLAALLGIVLTSGS